MNKINFLPPWVETNLQPAFYDVESGTVLQQVARMYAKVNQLVRNVNDQNNKIAEYVQKFIELKDYVDTYFDNLDVQEEINNKLDAMTEDGTLQEIVASYLQANVTWTFDTVEDLKDAPNLIEGSYARTLGYYSKGDNGGALYYITSTGTADNATVIELDSGVFANYVYEGSINVKQFGAKGDGITNDTTAIQKAFEANGNEPTNIVFDSGDYKLSGNVKLYNNTYVNLNNATIKANSNLEFSTAYENALTTGYGNLKNVVIENGTLEGKTSCGIHFNLFHAENCQFLNILFKNCFVDTHVFDLAGCKKITIKNCEFIGNLMDASLDDYKFREVIQPDYASKGGFPKWSSDPNVGYDNLPTIDLLVEGCIFKKNDDDIYYLNGIGTHAVSGTEPHENITVKNCEFYGSELSCIRLPWVKNAIIEDNIIYLIHGSDNGAINLNGVANDGITTDVTIRNNKCYDTYEDGDSRFIQVYRYSGSSRTANNINILNNYYDGWTEDGDTQGHECITLQNVDGINILGNTCIKAKQFVYKNASSSLSNMKIKNNTIDRCLRFVRSANTDTTPTVAGLDTFGNSIAYDSKSYDNANFSNKITLSSNASLVGQGNTWVRIPFDMSEMFSVTNTNNIKIPTFVEHGFKTGGSMTVTTTANAFLKMKVTVWDRVSSAVAASVTNYAYCHADEKTSVQLPVIKFISNSTITTSETDPNEGRYNVFYDLITFNNTVTIDHDFSESYIESL